jgi:hypothetical protein
MAAYAVLVGIKGDKKDAILVGDPKPVKDAFKTETLKGPDSKFDSIEVVDTRTGRSKRWRNTKAEKAKVAPAKSK